METSRFSIYILTNFHKTVLYIGVTNDLSRRLLEHMTGSFPGFTKKYNCCYLVYYEQFQYVNDAIYREKELKNWRREKKERLINSFNPDWKFLNNRFIRTCFQ